MFKRILIPLDDSPQSARALAHAIPFARAFEAECTLLTVVPDAVPVAAGNAGSAERTHAVTDFTDEWLDAEARLVDAREHLLQDEFMPAVIEVRPGQTVEQIVKVASEGHFDLIVLSTFDGEDRFHGSVADEVIRRTRIPLLLVHPDEPRAARERDVSL